MRTEAASSAVSFGLKLAAQAASGAAAGAGAAAAATGDQGMNILGAGLLGLAGVSGVSGALFFKANDRETAVRDTVVTILFPFLLAAGLGPTLGFEFFDRTGLAGPYQTSVAEHIVGGLIAGLVATPIVRHLISIPAGNVAEFFRRKGAGK